MPTTKQMVQKYHSGTFSHFVNLRIERRDPISFIFRSIFYPQFATINKRLIVLVFNALLPQWKGIVHTVEHANAFVV